MTTAQQTELFGRRPAKCRPHHWREPRPFDAELVCRCCGRTLIIEQLDDLRRMSILNAIAKREGFDAAQRFAEIISKEPDHVDAPAV